MAKGWHQTEEAKARISAAMAGRPSWNTGKKTGPCSEETKQKISRSHQRSGKKKLVRYTLTCVLCGETFQSKAPNAKACSDCLVAICVYCGKEFSVLYPEKVGEGINGPRKYCSTECYHASTIGKEPWNKDFIQVECQFCGKEFEVPSGRRETVKYCSRECKHNGMSQITGEAHPLWKGGFTLYGRMLSQNEGSFYRNRIKVLDRDKCTCCHCGFSGPSWYMDVHHIVPVRESGANTEGNLITLCRKCHNKADRGKISRRTLFQYISGHEKSQTPVLMRRTR
jgi:hypothetical protein